jgi:hypothetical protein
LRGFSLRSLGVAAIAVAAAAAWYAGARAKLAEGDRRQNSLAIDSAGALWTQNREQVQARLRSECRVLSEDPRLKSTVATRGMDERTLADVLEDLRKLTGSALLAVLTPEGKVQAVIGQGLATGLDLSGTAVVKSAGSTSDAAVGDWLVGDQFLEVSVSALRFGSHLVGYFVVGAPLGVEALGRLAAAGGVPLALIVANRVVASAPKESGLQAVFDNLANEAAPFEHRTLVEAGREYGARLLEIPGLTRSVRVAFVRSVEGGAVSGELAALLWVPFALLVAVGLWMAWRVRA